MTDETIVTVLEVDAHSAIEATTAYEQSMDRAQAASDKATSSAYETALAIAGVGAGMLGGIAAVRGFMDKVLEVNKGLADLQTQAKIAGLSLADLQGIKLGGSIAGLTDSQINAGLEKSAQLLNDASRNSNTLSKELAENGINIKNANGQLISQNQLLGIAADLIRRARNPGDQNAIAQMLGFTKEWIPLLEQGAGAMAGLTSEAQKVGAVIDDETIKRATEFDAQWRKSSVEFSSYMKAAMVGLLPYVDDLIDRAAKFAKGFNADALEKFANDQLRGGLSLPGGLKIPGADDLGVPDNIAAKVTLPDSTLENWSALGNDMVGVFTAIRDFANDESSLSMLDKLYRLFSASAPSSDAVTSKVRGLLPDVRVMPQEDFKWYGGTTGVTDTSDATMQSARHAASWLAEGAAWKKLSGDITAGGDVITGNFSKVAANAVATGGAFDRAEETLRKYIETTKAASVSVDASIGEQERLKAIAQLTAAGIKDGLTREVAAANAQLSGMATEAGKAADALAKAKTQSQIKFGRETAMLSSDDVAIATQLKGQYDSVAASLNSVEAQGLRTNAALRGISSSIEGTLVTGLTDISMGTKSAGAAFQDMSKLIIRSVEEMTIKMLIIKPLMSGLSGLFGGGGELPGFGTPSFVGPLPSANGNAFYGGSVIPFARGGIIDSPMIQPMALMGEAGPEAIVPLRRGADGNLGIAGGSGGGAVTVQGGDTHITIEGNADEKTLSIMKRELARRDAEMHSRVVIAVTQAKKMRQL